MGFESSNCSFGGIGMMFFWRDELGGGLPDIGDGVMVVFAHFIVQDFMTHRVTFSARWVMILPCDTLQC